MSNPRSESVRISRTNATEPIRHCGLPGFDAETKIDHYAYIGRLIRSGMDAFFSNESGLQDIRDAQTVSQLHTSLSEHLYQSIEQVLSSPQMQDTTETVRVSQGSRGEGHHPALEESLRAGIGTYILNSNGVYTAIQQEFGTDSAQHPENEAILDRISKLNIAYLRPYSRTYLDVAIYNELPNNRAAFVDQLVPTPSGGWRFKPGFPEEAYIPTELVKRKLSLTSADISITGNELFQLKDVPTHSVTVGCPFSFEPRDGRALWAVYASARASIERRQNVGQTIGDTAVSHSRMI